MGPFGFSALRLRRVALSISLLVAATSLLAGSALALTSPLPVPLTAHAVKLMIQCREGSTDDRSECYRYALPELYPAYSVAQLFDLIEYGQSFDDGLIDCHFIAHRIGERVAANDPARWFEYIREESPEGLCSYGYVHGVTITAFHDGVTDDEVRQEMPKFIEACNVDRENLRLSCLHALGHMMYYAADGDIAKALLYCDEATPQSKGDTSIFTDNRRCYTGAMMMLHFSVIDPDWKESTRYDLTRENVRPFCEELEDPGYVGACLRASWPLFSEDVQEDGGVDRFCSNQPDSRETAWCYAKLFVALGWLNINDPDRMRQQCEATTPEWQESCYDNAVQEYLAEGGGWRAVPRSVSLCERAGQEEVRASCFQTIAYLAGRFEAQGSDERRRFCEPLPPNWRTICEHTENR